MGRPRKVKIVKTDKKVKINKKFAPLWTLGKTRYYIVYGGRGSGKSFATQLALAHRLMKINQVIANTRYVLRNAEDSVIPEFTEKLELAFPDWQEIFQIVKSKNEVVNLLNNSKVMFRGFKTSTGLNTANIKSIKGLNIWLMEEAEELTEQIFDTMDLSIRAKNTENAIVLVFNPMTKNHWIYKRFFEERGLPDTFSGVYENTTYIFTTYLDNIQNLSESFLQKAELLKKTNPEKYKHKLLGAWLPRAEGVIFDSFEVARFQYADVTAYGLDFGLLDPSALIEVSIDRKRKILYVRELLYQTGLSSNELVELVSKKVKANVPIIADSANPMTIKDLRKAGLNVRPVKKFPNSIIEGIRAMKSFRLVVDSQSVNIIRELNSYVWLDKRGEVPADEFNHAIDAIRYVVLTFAHRKNQNATPKEIKF